MGNIVNLFGGPIARLYRRSLTDQGFEVLMVAVFDIAARQGYAVARGIVKELAAAQYPLGGSLAPCPSPRRAYRTEGVSRSRRRGEVETRC